MQMASEIRTPRWRPAWEEDGKVQLYAFRSEGFDLDMLASRGPVVFPPEHQTTLYRMTLDPRTNKTSQVQLAPHGMALDFPAAHPGLEGAKMRYAYAARFDEAHSFKIKSIVKLDLSKPPGKVVVDEYAFGPERFGGDCAFVPKKGRAIKGGQAGYLVTFVRDEAKDLSSVEIIDAAKIGAGPIAKVHIPCRVPYGFHSYFLSDAINP